jgi:hypothetical protein
MADLTYKDWGRIYAYAWLQDRVGNSYYKDLLEQDPVKGIEAIVQALNREYPDPNLKIEYKPGDDTIWDIEMPTGLWPELKKGRTALKAYRKGGDDSKLATLRMRLAC